ncbi:hypothetical protein [Pseudescherichia sp.]|uniref:hypothetical protein n=1 Tax=Pseudescherichia sp. TaxID=2055881 RepID=UPI00289658CB|nr:hypothetical protein [Pseudescherichia sp.]
MATVNGISNATAYLKQKGREFGKNFQNEIINRSKALAMKMQKDMNNAVDKGGVPFTQRSILFMYKKTGTGVRTTILVKNVQAKYLYDILVKEKAIDKFVPTSKARLTKQGNISGLQKNLQTGRYKIAKGKNGKVRLIDTTQKKKEKRIIAVRERKKRKLIYDFYGEAEKGARMILSGIKGTFIFKKG